MKFSRGTSSQSCNEFIGLLSDVNFIIPRDPLVLGRDSFFTSTLRSALQMSAL